MSEVNSRLLELVDDMGLELIFCDMNRSGMYYSEEKTIFINNKLLEKNSDFEISHELGHCIKKHDKLTDYYNINEYSRNKLEYETNQIAIQILLTIWINEYDLQKEQLNAVKFMEYYQIPSRLEFCVKETMLNYQ